MLEDFDGSATIAGYPFLCAIHLLADKVLLVSQSKDVSDKDCTFKLKWSQTSSKIVSTNLLGYLLQLLPCTSVSSFPLLFA